MAEQEKKEELTPKKEDPLFSKGSLVLGQYEIIREIGRGGMNSIIYLAEDTTIDLNKYPLQSKNVAVKVVTKNNTITEAEWIKFMDECVTCNRVGNLPNIVKTYQVAKINNDNTIVIVMEYIDGISLRDYLNTHGYLSIQESIYLFQKILLGIKELHSFKQKIIHRDLKPENILLTHDLRQVKIIDFGISSVVEIKQDSENSVLTNENALYGTYPYISPDIFQLKQSSESKINSNFISEQFDFYSLGIIFYEMLIGKKPFYADNYNNAQVIKLPLTYDMPIMSDINPNITPAIENIIFRCIASKPSDIRYRYHSVQEIINDLDAVEKQKVNLVDQKLIKSRKERTFQTKNVFDVTKQKERERFYEKWWFFWSITLFALAIVIITLTLRYIE